MTEPLLAVVSAGRPGNVPEQVALWAPLPTVWYVPADQAGDYRYAGAEVRPVPVPEGEYGLVWQRNAALVDGHSDGRPVVMTDDDLRRIAWTEPDGTNNKSVITGPQAISRLLGSLVASGLMLAGAAPTDNAYFCTKATSRDLFIRDGITAHLPNPLRYDPRLPLKLDYDMTLQHLERFGGALRVNRLLMSYQQRAKKGGCDYRSPELEEQCIDVLLAKWPASIKRHATRAHEVSIKWRPAKPLVDVLHEGP